MYEVIHFRMGSFQKHFPPNTTFFEEKKKAQKVIDLEGLEIVFETPYGNPSINLYEKKIHFLYCHLQTQEKTFFYCVAQAMINSGYIDNFNRFSSFPSMEAVDKRILVWNEPNAEPSAFEDLKKLFGGDPCNCKVKFKGDSIVMRTPIIVLSNEDIFPADKAFRTRMLKYKWKPAVFLREVRKKPHSLAFSYLLAKYNIIDTFKLQNFDLNIVFKNMPQQDEDGPSSRKISTSNTQHISQ